MMTAHDLGLLVALGHQEFVRQLRTELGRRGFDDLGRSDGYVLRALQVASLTVTELAGQLAVSKQAASQIVEDLCRRGYLQRRPDPADARAWRLALTGRGEGVLLAARRFQTRYERRLVRDHGADALDVVRAILTDMAGTSAAGEPGAPALAI
jgi:DNA-binding MarR family transcriptional regulator